MNVSPPLLLALLQELTEGAANFKPGSLADVVGLADALLQAPPASLRNPAQRLLWVIGGSGSGKNTFAAAFARQRSWRPAKSPCVGVRDLCPRPPLMMCAHSK